MACISFVIAGINIGYPVLGIVFITMVKLVNIARIIIDFIYFTTDEIIVVSNFFKTVVAVVGHCPKPVILQQGIHITVYIVSIISAGSIVAINRRIDRFTIDNRTIVLQHIIILRITYPVAQC